MRLIPIRFAFTKNPSPNELQGQWPDERSSDVLAKSPPSFDYELLALFACLREITRPTMAQLRALGRSGLYKMEVSLEFQQHTAHKTGR